VKSAWSELLILSGNNRMDKSMWQRREFLYLGLGLVGAGVATTVGATASQDNFGSAHQIAAANSQDPIESDAAKILALQSTGESLPEFQGISG
jgi:hypothetical protein